MEAIITLLIANIFIVIIGIVINTKVSKIRKNKWIEFMVDKVTLENINTTDCFSKDVISFYLNVLKETNRYSLGNCILQEQGNEISVWAANDITSRRFYTHNTELAKQVKIMNNKLTCYDKILLDKLVQSFKSRQDKLVTKFFI